MSTLKDKINRILGNNVRLLLPSYWWKRAFGLVADGVDNVEKLANSSQARVDKLEKRVTSQDTRIEEAISLVEESAIPLVESKEDLESLDSPLGTIARVAYEGNKKINILECKTPTKEDTEESIIQNWSEYTRITKIESTVPVGSDTNILFLVQFFNPKEEESVAAISFDNGACIATLISSNNGEQHTRNLTLDEFNVVLQQKDYRLLKVDYSTELDVINFITNYMTFYGPPTVSDAYIKGETWKKILKEGDTTNGNGNNFIVTYNENDLSEEDKSCNSEFYNFFIYNTSTPFIVHLKELFASGTSVMHHVARVYKEFNENGTEVKLLTFGSANDFNLGTVVDAKKIYTLKSDGRVTKIEDFIVDKELSTTSTKAVRNRVVTIAINNKADKTYVDEAIAQAITNTLNTAV